MEPRLAMKLHVARAPVILPGLPSRPPPHCDAEVRGTWPLARNRIHPSFKRRCAKTAVAVRKTDPVFQPELQAVVEERLEAERRVGGVWFKV